MIMVELDGRQRMPMTALETATDREGIPRKTGHRVSQLVKSGP